MNYDEIQTKYPNLDVIPVRKNSKIPLRKNWQRISPEKQWEGLDGDYNIGVRPSNGLIIFDADDEDTEDKLLSMFPDVTVDRTQSGGTHFFIFVDDIEGIKLRYNKQYKVMQAYKGEIRFGSGSQTLLPPSKVKREDGSFGHYKLLQGDFTTIPTYELEYVIEMMDELIGKSVKKQPVRSGKQRKTSTTTFSSLVVPLHKQRLYPHLENKLEWLKTAESKDSYSFNGRSWDTRNELEFDIVGDLILSGWDIGDIQDVFEQYQSGHYIESANPDQYLEKLYQSAMEGVLNNPLIDELQRCFLMADTTDIYSKERVIILALLSFAVQFKSREFYLSKLTISGVTSMLGNKSVNKYLNNIITRYSIKTHYNVDGVLYYDLTKLIEYFLLKDDAEKARQHNLKRTCVIMSASSLEEYLMTQYKMGDSRINILKELLHGDKTMRELTDLLTITRQSITYHIEKLINGGLIERIGSYFKLIVENVPSAINVKALVVVTKEKIKEKLKVWAFFKERIGLSKIGIKNMELYYSADRVNARNSRITLA